MRLTCPIALKEIRSINFGEPPHPCFCIGAVIASILSVMIRKTLKILWIIQEQEHKDPFKRGYFKRRMNPFNPLTYISILIIVLVGFLMFGFVGFWKEVDLRNPFRWSS
jgi:hypothetical protein